MPRFDLTLDIARPPDDVFALLTDIERLPEWQESAITASADGELGVGTVIGEQRRFMGRDIKTTDEVTAYEPPRPFDVKSRGGPVAYEIHHLLEPDGTGPPPPTPPAGSTSSHAAGLSRTRSITCSSRTGRVPGSAWTSTSRSAR